MFKGLYCESDKPLSKLSLETIMIDLLNLIINYLLLLFVGEEINDNYGANYANMPRQVEIIHYTGCTLQNMII